MQQREFIIMLYRAAIYFADDPQTGKGQRRGLLLACSAVRQYYQLDIAPPPSNTDYDQLQRYGKRKAQRIVPTEQEAKQDKEILDMAHAF